MKINLIYVLIFYPSEHDEDDFQVIKAFDYRIFAEKFAIDLYNKANDYLVTDFREIHDYEIREIEFVTTGDD